MVVRIVKETGGSGKIHLLHREGFEPWFCRLVIPAYVCLYSYTAILTLVISGTSSSRTARESPLNSSSRTLNGMPIPQVMNRVDILLVGALELPGDRSVQEDNHYGNCTGAKTIYRTGYNA